MAGALPEERVRWPSVAQSWRHVSSCTGRAFTTLAGVSAMVPVEHQPWRLHHAPVVALDEDLFAAAGVSAPSGPPG
ncbi:MAG TPA: hypothetical protein VGR26_09245 [Acidimicrobiales bacterium]|nr:hypothetical protein [Acidimicrobiales bacterium]